MTSGLDSPGSIGKEGSETLKSQDKYEPGCQYVKEPNQELRVQLGGGVLAYMPRALESILLTGKERKVGERN